MKTHKTIFLAALALLISTACLRGAEEKPEVMINRAVTVIMTPSTPSTEVVAKALVEILNASLLILPKTDYAEEYKSRIESVKKLLVEGSIFSDKVHQYLGLAHKLVTGGIAWKVPEELTSAYREKDIMAQAKKICQRSIDSALAELEAGRSEQSVRYLLEFVLTIITPIEA
jgi:hypothetical protein